MQTLAASHQPAAVRTFFDSVTSGKRSGVPASKVLADNATRVPANVQAMLARYPEAAHGALLDAVAEGIDKYTKDHGHAPSGSFVASVIHNVNAECRPLKDIVQGGFRFDSATNVHHEQLSLDPAAAIVSILQQFSETVPFANYLPADVKSNEARLIIVAHEARSTYGEYDDGANLNGINAGGQYLMGERTITVTSNGGAGPFAGVVTAKVDGSGVALKLLRGRAQLLVNGVPVGREIQNSSGSGSQAVAGSVTIASTTYTLGGTVNSDTGAISITTSSALPAGTKVDVLVYVDYERQPEVTPRLGVRADVFQMYANPSRALVLNSVDSYGQFAAEVNVDSRSQGLIALRNQFAAERHYNAVKKMLAIAAGFAYTWDYDWTNQKGQKSRSQVWENLQPVLGKASQDMANATMDHGITTLYMTGELAAQVQGLPRDMFAPSGVTERPGIYRLGRLWDKYEVYYMPKHLVESGGGDTSQILAIGRSADVARNPIIFGDAIPGMFLPLAMGTDMVYQDGFYTRSFTEVNPHQPSAKAAALINVTDIK